MCLSSGDFFIFWYEPLSFFIPCECQHWLDTRVVCKIRSPIVFKKKNTIICNELYVVGKPVFLHSPHSERCVLPFYKIIYVHFFLLPAFSTRSKMRIKMTSCTIRVRKENKITYEDGNQLP